MIIFHDEILVLKDNVRKKDWKGIRGERPMPRVTQHGREN
jgi:hypothetical protein